MACVVLKPGCSCTVEELIAFTRQELGQYKTPKVIKLVSFQLFVTNPVGSAGTDYRGQASYLC